MYSSPDLKTSSIRWRRFSSVDSTIYLSDIPGVAEGFGFAVFSFTGDFYAVVNHATENAGFAVEAKVVDDLDAAVSPVERVGWARFYTKFALDTDTRVWIDGYGSFGVEIFIFVLGGFEKFLSLSFSWFFWLLLRIVRKHVEYIKGLRVFLRHL